MTERAPCSACGAARLTGGKYGYCRLCRLIVEAHYRRVRAAGARPCPCGGVIRSTASVCAACRRQLDQTRYRKPGRVCSCGSPIKRYYRGTACPDCVSVRHREQRLEAGKS